jgi:glycosyltransferase involved in cell wall biosynthesis
MMNLHFIIPGDINTPAGEFIYIKKIIDGLRGKKYKVFMHNLPGDFPFPGENSLTQCEILLNSMPSDDMVLIHSTAFGSVPALIEKCAITHKLVGLIHMPTLMGKDLSIYQKELVLSAEKTIYTYVKHYIVSNEYAQNTLLEKGLAASQIHMVAPGIDNYPLRATYPQVPKNLLSIANYTRKNGLINLVKALSALKTKNWVLSCYGSKDFDMPYVNEINMLIRRNGLSDRIYLHGPVPHDKISEIYQHADLFIQPSDHETFGMTISEALMHGIPILASSGGLINKTIPQTMAKFFKPGNIYDIQSILELLLDNPSIYSDLCKHASQFHTTARNWTETIADFEKAMLSIDASFAH